MSKTLIITGSPSGTSKTAKLANLVGSRLARSGIDSTLLDVRSLPAEDLLLARASAPAIQSALAQVEAARGVVIATPVYKAAYSGLLKTFLDVLPQFGLRDKVVLPLATGGTVAHVLAIDYALRPVLSSLDPLHVVPGLFVLDKQLTVKDDGSLELDADLSGKLDAAITSFRNGFHRAAHEVPVS
ncbi:MAG TPA: NADPH-dependent FMN reductase [Polyangiaceae bacterium]|jgi:FMN reductase|nr:NADPH-dependent FMN reductase [Polyangiaceae bacterium]